MEENKNLGQDATLADKDEQSSLNFQTIYTIAVLHWKWFVLSIILCLGCAMVYLRYKTPQYKAVAKLLIKDDDSNSSRSGKSAILTTANLGFMSNSTGIDNEMEILSSLSIAQQAVRDLKL